MRLCVFLLLLLAVAASPASLCAAEVPPAIEVTPEPLLIAAPVLAPVPLWVPLPFAPAWQVVDAMPLGDLVPMTEPVLQADAVAEDAAANANDLAQQILPQCREVLKAELLFLDSVCQPTKEQRRKLSQAGDKSAQEAAKGFADVQLKMMQGQVNGQPAYPDPRHIIQQGLTKSVRAHLSPEQAARYQVEIDKRKASLQRVAVLNLVARLDVELVLSIEQRDKLLAALARNWQEAWGQALEMYVNHEQLLPNLPDGIVTPILTETQKQVWQGAQKNQAVMWGGFGFGFMFSEDEPPAEGPPAEVSESAPQPEEKK